MHRKHISRFSQSLYEIFIIVYDLVFSYCLVSVSDVFLLLKLKNKYYCTAVKFIYKRQLKHNFNYPAKTFLSIELYLEFY